MTSVFDLTELGQTLGGIEVGQQEEFRDGDRLGTVDPRELIFDLNQPRGEEDQEETDQNVLDIAGSIASTRLEQFPVVSLTPEGTKLRLGECRTRAFLHLLATFTGEPSTKNYWGYTKMPAIFRTYEAENGLEEEEVVLVAQLMENSKRKTPKPLSEAKKIGKLVSTHGVQKVIEIFEAKDKKVSSSWISKRLALLKVDAEVHKDCNDQKIYDIETRTLLGRIYSDNKPEYFGLMEANSKELLAKSLRQEASEVWQRLENARFDPPKSPPVNLSSGGGHTRLPSESRDYDDKGGKATDADKKADWQRQQDALAIKEREQKLQAQSTEQATTEQVGQQGSEEEQLDLLDSTEIGNSNNASQNATGSADESESTPEADSQRLPSKMVMKLEAEDVKSENGKIAYLVDDCWYEFTLPEGFKVELEKK